MILTSNKFSIPTKMQEGEALVGEVFVEEVVEGEAGAEAVLSGVTLNLQAIIIKEVRVLTIQNCILLDANLGLNAKI